MRKVLGGQWHSHISTHALVETGTRNEVLSFRKTENIRNDLQNKKYIYEIQKFLPTLRTFKTP